MNEFYMQRHLKLWEDNNKQLNRVVFLTVVLSLALIIKVLTPFVDFSEDKKPVIETIASLNSEKESVNKKISIIRETTEVLEDVNTFISQQPWQTEKKDLIQRYKEMRVSPPIEGYSRERYQQEADITINKIIELSDENILLPLQRSIDGIDTEKDNPDVLISELKSLDQFFVDWKNEYINKDWYRTIDRKDRTMYELTESLNQRLDAFSEVIMSELGKVKRIERTVDSKLKLLNTEIETEAEKLQSLDDELQKILPEWLRGLVKIDQVIQLLPVALFGAAIFVLVTGINLTRHFTIYVNANNFSRDITDDPGMSTTWTLIHRGLLGSILTTSAYTLVIVITWLLFEESMCLLLDWLSIDPTNAWVSSYGFWTAFLWAGRAGFALIFTFIIIKLKNILYVDD